MMGQGSQGNSMMSQRPMGSYRSSQQGRCLTSSWSNVAVGLVCILCWMDERVKFRKRPSSVALDGTVSQLMCWCATEALERAR